MIHLINVPRYVLIVIVLLVSFLFSPAAIAKHIIVIYDVSGSMISLKIGRDVNIYMKSEDIHRVNEYLTNLLFTDTSQSLRYTDDSYIKECEAAFVGKPLYQTGDILTYAEYAKQRSTKIDREQVRRDEFQSQLPDPTDLKDSFYGQVSYLLRAEVEVYDELYSNTDDETYWIFVTDGDIDNSGKSDPGISSVLKRQAEIESEYYAPIIFSIFVNKHVKIQVRRLRKRDDIKTIFIATPTKPKELVRKIQLSRDDKGKFASETLTIDTENSAKTKFKLNNVNVEIVDRNNKPLQIVNEDDTTEILSVTPVPLHGNPPPYDFQIMLPANPEIANPNSAMKLEITYTYDSEDKVYSAPRMNYTAVIDSIYVAVLENPDHPTKQLDLIFSEGIFGEDLTIESESPNKDAFQIDQIRCQIQYRDNRKLCNVTVPKTITRLGKPFRIEAAKQARLDWHGNQLVLDIDYQYEGEPQSTTIKIPYKTQGGRGGFPMWMLWFLLIPFLLALFFLLKGRLRPFVHQIALTEVSVAGTSLHKTFTLKDKDTVEFGARGTDELRFDVGSEAFLYCSKKNLMLFANPDDDDGHILDIPETLTLSRSEDDDEVHIRCEVVDDSLDEPEEVAEPISDPNSSDRNPLDV